MLRNNLAKIGITFAVVAALVVGVAIPVSAAATTAVTTSSAPVLHIVQGTVTSVADDKASFNIQEGKNPTVKVTVDSNTKYYKVSTGGVQSYIKNQVSTDIKQDNGKSSVAGTMKELHIPANWRDNLGWLDTFNKDASFGDIAVSDRIIARVDSNKNNLAAQVLIIKAPVIKQVRGTVTFSGSNVITILTSTNTTITLNWDSNTEFIMKGVTSAPSGQYGVVTYNSSTNPGLALLVNLAVKEPTPVVTPNTTTTH